MIERILSFSIAKLECVVLFKQVSKDSKNLITKKIWFFILKPIHLMNFWQELLCRYRTRNTCYDIEVGNLVQLNYITQLQQKNYCQWKILLMVLNVFNWNNIYRDSKGEFDIMENKKLTIKIWLKYLTYHTFQCKYIPILTSPMTQPKNE